MKVVNQPRFEVSDLGRVRLVSTGAIVRTHKSKGYLKVSLKGCVSSVHRLVAMAFCPGYSSELHVNHINAIKIDNRAVNLEWVTVRENVMHAYKTGQHPATQKRTKTYVKSTRNKSHLQELTDNVLNSLLFVDYDDFIKRSA